MAPLISQKPDIKVPLEFRGNNFYVKTHKHIFIDKNFYVAYTNGKDTPKEIKEVHEFIFENPNWYEVKRMGTEAKNININIKENTLEIRPVYEPPIIYPISKYNFELHLHKDTQNNYTYVFVIDDYKITMELLMAKIVKYHQNAEETYKYIEYEKYCDFDDGCSVYVVEDVDYQEIMRDALSGFAKGTTNKYRPIDDSKLLQIYKYFENRNTLHKYITKIRNSNTESLQVLHSKVRELIENNADITYEQNESFIKLIDFIDNLNEKWKIYHGDKHLGNLYTHVVEFTKNVNQIYNDAIAKKANSGDAIAKKANSGDAIAKKANSGDANGTNGTGSTSSTGGARRSTPNLRRFTVVRTSCGESGGVYSSESGPAAAAKKAASKRFSTCAAAGINIIHLTIRETGRTNSDRVFSYIATRTGKTGKVDIKASKG